MASGTPSEFNDNWGSNYGLDGFYAEMEMGEGVLNQPNVGRPTDVGKAGIPEGFMYASQQTLDVPDSLTPEFDMPSFDDYDLGGDSSPHLASYFPKNKPLADFSWLEDATQDPARLPNQEGLNSLKALEALWGSKTDGVHRLPVKDREDYLSQKLKRPLDDDPFNIDKIAKQNKLASAVTAAMRDSARQRPLSEIETSLVLASQGDLKAIATPLKLLRLDHGLVGNVYIRASAYPGLERGKWNKELAKVAKRVRYIIASPGQNVAPVAEMYHLSVVASPGQIPWDMELEYHKPFFASQQRRVDESVPSIQAMKLAFLSPDKGPERSILKATGVRTEQARVGTKEADRNLAAFKPVKAEIKSLASRLFEKADAKAIKKMGAWVDARMLTQEEFEKIASLPLPPHLAIERVASLIALRTGKTASYKGDGEGAVEGQLQRWLRNASGSKAEAEIQEAHHQFVKQAKAKLAKERVETFRKLGTMVQANLITAEEFAQIQGSNLPNEMLLRKAAELAGRVQSRDYTGFRNENGVLLGASDKKIKADLKKETRRMEAETGQMSHRAARVELEAKCSAIKTAIKQGLTGARLASLIREMIPAQNLEAAKVYLNPILAKTNALGTKPAPKVAQYQGKKYHEHAPQKASARDADVPAVLKYAGHQMNMGKAGDVLNETLVAKFGVAEVQASLPALVQIRAKNEGLAGFSYVDPSVYFTDGLKGCAKGAALTKGSAAAFLLASDKCRDCSARSHGSCSKYNKRLVASPPSDRDVEELRASNIKTANWANVPDESFFQDGDRQLEEEGLSPDLNSGMFIELDPIRTDRDIQF